MYEIGFRMKNVVKDERRSCKYEFLERQQQIGNSGDTILPLNFLSLKYSDKDSKTDRQYSTDSKTDRQTVQYRQ